MFFIHGVLLLLLIFALRLTTANEVNTSFPIVETRQGKVKGTVMVSTNGEQFFAFRGIPYAKAPVSEQRFKLPEPADPWNGIFNAGEEASECPQLTNDEAYIGDEDCLTITVYTHLIASGNYSKLLPVLIFIHGGVFIAGSASTTYVNPVRILNQDVVFVVPQYRLGALGLLSVGGAEATGNYAFYDQRLAMKWVKNNIAAFGGDPQRVTLSGTSAGAISAGFHVVSKMSSELFRGVIMQSGPTLQAMQLQTEPLKYAMQLSDELECNAGSNPSTIVKCLRGKTAKEIVEATSKLQGYDSHKVPIPFAAVIEHGGNDVFLTDFPQNLLKAGQYNNVPLLIGNVLNEAAYFFKKSSFNYVTKLPIITKEMMRFALKNIVPHYLVVITKYENNITEIIDAAEKQYLKGVNLHNKTKLFQTLINALSDATFKASTDSMTRYLALHNTPVYLYSFEYMGDQGDTIIAGVKQIDHGNDNDYLLLRKQTNKDEKMSDLLGAHWRNFVHNLNPTLSSGEHAWIKVPSPPPKDLPYLKYGSDGIGMQDGFFTETMEFWNAKVPKIVNGGLNLTIRQIKPAHRVLVSGEVTHSKKYRKVQKRNSYTVQTISKKFFMIDIFMIVEGYDDNYFAVGHYRKPMKRAFFPGFCDNASNLLMFESDPEINVSAISISDIFRNVVLINVLKDRCALACVQHNLNEVLQ